MRNDNSRPLDEGDKMPRFIVAAQPSIDLTMRKEDVILADLVRQDVGPSRPGRMLAGGKGTSSRFGVQLGDPEESHNPTARCR